MICFQRVFRGGSSILGRDILLFSEEPPRTTTGAFLAGAFFFLETTRTLYFGTNLGDFWFLRKCKRRRKEPEEGPTKYQPVMFDMDPFGDKKVLGTMDRVPRPSAVHWTAYRVPAVHGPRYP